ncbi:hypothetical protein BCR41DRAFT_372169 [Lobosporangium transversale]|uniref:Uncharacterized protein n=1 Tax=Lobosporangium transversale TaxID=64571 RepID=A0A1Y2GHV0_9FUNG|nr:hypothetical protein BCR41DRAFT_372169 [Lobosporangium transversale]ORZ11348.1 hypothetical protein BCR41DRAFT_372169 [Lobosporangium transversale]|eukprot:XP_021879663.1 hypothetical protein BCR41DRAFT_372169 [Lobosporangium transversale]
MDVIRTLYAQQKALGSFEFFESMPERNKFLLYDDRPEFIRSQRRRLRSVNPNFVADGLGKKYYLNEEVDLAKALAPDSDQDVETDDGVSAEEQAEVELEAPHAVVRESLLHSPNSLTNVYSQEKSELRHWDTFWSTTARNARQVTPSERKRYRFRETHPLVPVPMDFDTWQEGVQRLAANSHALPMAVATDAGLSTVDTAYDAPVQSMNKTKRTFEQSLYFEKKGYVEKHKPHDVKFARVEKYAERMAEKARTVPVRPLETYSPGYGVLPKNTSFMYDATRTPPKNGYGLGERNVGGLWFKDKKSNGYITVSDSEDEEEEERGWQRQMQADLQIEQASSNHGVGE